MTIVKFNGFCELFDKFLSLQKFGFVSVLASLVFMSHLRQLAHLFLANLALFDLGVMFMNCIALTGVVWGDSVMRDNPVLCEVSGIICMVACFGSLWTMMFVAINR